MAVKTLISMLASKRLKALTGKGAQGHGSKNSNTPVVGMVERGGKLHAMATKGTGSNALMTLACTHIDIDAVDIYR